MSQNNDTDSVSSQTSTCHAQSESIPDDTGFESDRKDVLIEDTVHTSAYVSLRQSSLVLFSHHASPGAENGEKREHRTRKTPSAYVITRQHTSAYVSIRQHTSSYVSIRQHTSACVRRRHHTSACVSIRHHTTVLPLRSSCRSTYVNIVYYESINRELKIKCIYDCRCYERLQIETKEFTRLGYTGLVVELEHLKIETRLIIEKFASAMGEYVTNLCLLLIDKARTTDKVYI
jgi:hypothetical protein